MQEAIPVQIDPECWRQSGKPFALFPIGSRDGRTGEQVLQIERERENTTLSCISFTRGTWCHLGTRTLAGVNATLHDARKKIVECDGFMNSETWL